MAGSSTSAGPRSGSGTSRTTSRDPCSRLAGSDRIYTPKCDEPVKRWVLLTIIDDGVGPEAAAAFGDGVGFGLSGLAERVRSAGGVLTFGPQTGGGASLGVWVPQRRAEETSTAERDTEQRSAL